MPASTLLRNVADYCWSNNFLGIMKLIFEIQKYENNLPHSLVLDVFRNFFKEHAVIFEGAPPMHNGEHDLKYYSLFQTYLKLYEVRILLFSLL
jgi:hypothetical protein